MKLEPVGDTVEPTSNALQPWPALHLWQESRLRLYLWNSVPRPSLKDLPRPSFGGQKFCLGKSITASLLQCPLFLN